MNFILKKRLFVLFIITVFGGLISAVYYLPPSRSGLKQPLSQDTTEETKVSAPSLKIGDTTIAIELATTSTAIARGLSGRNSLGENNGMLFVFSRADKYRFWMPDMHFPIDIIWINNSKVVDIDENASNKFDRSNPVFYIPNVPAQYVLEVNAGLAKNRNINIGDMVSFYNINKL